MDDKLRDLVAEVAAAYFSNSHVPPTDIPTVIRQIAESLGSVGLNAEAELPVPDQRDSARPKTARIVSPAAKDPPSSIKATSAQIRKSISDDAIISFEDGKAYKTLKRHLSTRGLSPEQYREKWGLPHDYPIVAPSLSAQRAAMAKSNGLGHSRSASASRRASPKSATATSRLARNAKAALKA